MIKCNIRICYANGLGDNCNFSVDKNKYHEDERGKFVKSDYANMYRSLDCSHGLPDVLCGDCLSDMFKIEYGQWECFAVCDCGNKVLIYDG